MLKLRYNKSLHHQALHLYWEIHAFSEACIKTRGDQPYIAKGATKEQVSEWELRHQELQPFLESRFDFKTTFTKV